MADATAFTPTPDPTGGEPVAVVTVTNANSDVVDQQVVTIGDPTDGTLHAAVTSSGLQVQIGSISGSVSVSNLPATQAISGTVALATGTATVGAVTIATGSAAIGSVSVSNLPATQVVALATGAAVIGTVAQGAAGSTAWLISGAVTVTGSVQLVTGTATLGAVTIATGAAVIGALATGTATLGQVVLATGAAVIGAIATGSATLGQVQLATGAAVIGVLGTGATTIGFVAQGAAGSTAWLISGAVTITGTVVNATGTATIGAVTIATGSATLGQVVLATGAAVIGALATGTATLGQVVLATGTATLGAVTIATGAAVIGAIATGTATLGQVVLATGTATIGAVTLATNAATTIIGVEPKDTGRTVIALTFVSATATATEALASMTILKGLTTVTAATTYTVTTGKTFRIQSVAVGGRLTTATNEIFCRVNVRTATVVTAASPAAIALDTGTAETGTLVANSAFFPVHFAIPDGLEVAAGNQVGVSHVANATTGVITTTVLGYEY